MAFQVPRAPRVPYPRPRDSKRRPMAASLGQGAEERGGRSVRRTVNRNSGVPVHPHQLPDLVCRRTISSETDEQASNAPSPLPTAPSPPSRGIKVHPWIFKLSTPHQGEYCRGLFAGRAARRGTTSFLARLCHAPPEGVNRSGDISSPTAPTVLIAYF